MTHEVRLPKWSPSPGELTPAVWRSVFMLGYLQAPPGRWSSRGLPLLRGSFASQCRPDRPARGPLEEASRGLLLPGSGSALSPSTCISSGSREPLGLGNPCLAFPSQIAQLWDRPFGTTFPSYFFGNLNQLPEGRNPTVQESVPEGKCSPPLPWTGAIIQPKR